MMNQTGEITLNQLKEQKEFVHSYFRELRKAQLQQEKADATGSDPTRAATPEGGQLVLYEDAGEEEAALGMNQADA
jgi:hypothetical protein